MADRPIPDNPLYDRIFPNRQCPPQPHRCACRPTPPATERVPQSRWQEILRSPHWMVLVAFLVRVVWIVLAHTYRIRTSEDNLGFGWEIGRLAYSLANGHGLQLSFWRQIPVRQHGLRPSIRGSSRWPFAFSAATLARVGVFTAGIQQPLRRAHLLDHLSHRPPHLQSTRSPFGRVGFGRCFPTPSSGR